MGADFKLESRNHFSRYDCAIIIDPLGFISSNQWATAVKDTSIAITAVGFHQLYPKFISEESSEALFTKNVVMVQGKGRLDTGL